MSGPYLNSPRSDDDIDNIHSPGYKEKWGDLARQQLSQKNISEALYRIHKIYTGNSPMLALNLNDRGNCDKIARSLCEGTISPVISILDK